MRWVVLVPLALVVLTALAIFVGRRLKEAAVVVENARDEAWTCCLCHAHDWEQHDPWCPDRPTVVAGSDLDWQLDLQRIYRDYDAYRLEHRLPGESR